MTFTFTLGNKLPQDLGSETRYKPVYDRVLALEISTEKEEHWMEIGGLPNNLATGRLQACLTPSKGGKSKTRAYQAGLIEQGAKVRSKRQLHKDGTYSLWVKKIKA